MSLQFSIAELNQILEATDPKDISVRGGIEGIAHGLCSSTNNKNHPRRVFIIANKQIRDQYSSRPQNQTTP
jgi:hypothetical protein